MFSSKKFRPTRQKINFMIDENIMVEVKQYIPDGERSNFVNEALVEALENFKRHKAIEGIEKIRKKAKLKMSDAEINSLKNYGRE